MVVSAGLRLRPGEREVSEAEISEIVRWRREHQPGGQNCGSVFVNPVPGEVSAGLLVDGLGLRGLRIGSAWVSEKHANFIQAAEGGSAADVRAVIEAVRARVAEETGVRLRSEVRLVGFGDDACERGARSASPRPRSSMSCCGRSPPMPLIPRCSSRSTWRAPPSRNCWNLSLHLRLNLKLKDESEVEAETSVPDAPQPIVIDGTGEAADPTPPSRARRDDLHRRSPDRRDDGARGCHGRAADRAAVPRPAHRRPAGRRAQAAAVGRRRAGRGARRGRHPGSARFVVVRHRRRRGRGGGVHRRGTPRRRRRRPRRDARAARRYGRGRAGARGDPVGGGRPGAHRLPARRQDRAPRALPRRPPSREPTDAGASSTTTDGCSTCSTANRWTTCSC